MKKSILVLAGFGLCLTLASGFSSKNFLEGTENELDSLFAALTQEQKHDLRYAEGALQVTDGLSAKLFASEPTITNPTNIDIDHRGRVWVLEAYNYRPAITGNETHADGDRVMILEDTDGDGVADKNKVFYQDKDLNAPLGIMVLGGPTQVNRVLVSQSPYVYLLTDEDGDDKADKKEIVFQGVGGDQHDHGIHAFVFGPDGKFYFNFGNSGEQLLDANGKVVKDIEGREINKKNFKQGVVFRCDQNFGNVEVLAQNFRNNYEVALDSYGTMWQSDNDDDGNRSVRINYVMQHGNYGYVDELTNAAWRVNRTNMETQLPERHWHLNDPGVVPNLLHTGAGSPTGMVVYEGSLLPNRFRNQMIHCDAGPNVVRSYPVKKNGAGYTANFENIVFGKRNKWFRPSDVCVAPDGSLFVSDWYDPGVGGHQAGDLNRGRIFRVAPSGTRYTPPTTDIATVSGVMQALQSPCMSIRYMAWNTLYKSGTLAEATLKDFLENKGDGRQKARVLWLLSKLPNGQNYIENGLKSLNPDLKCVAIRAAQQIPDVFNKINFSDIVQSSDQQVRREMALALRKSTRPDAAKLWAKLANSYEGENRWELEALGIGADENWDDYLGEYLKLNQNPLGTKAGRDIVWRARTGKNTQFLEQLSSENGVDLKDRLRYFRAFDYNPDTKGKSEALLNIMRQDGSAEVTKLCIRHLDPEFTKSSIEAMQGLKKLLDTSYGTMDYIELAQRFELDSENPRLLAMATENKGYGREAVKQLLKQNGSAAAWLVLNGTDKSKVESLIGSLRGVGNKASLDMLKTLALDKKRPKNIRTEATKAIGGSWDGEEEILTLLKQNKIPKEYIAAAVQGVSGAWRSSVRTEAAGYLPTTLKPKATQSHPPVAELMTKKGDVANGKKMFASYCSTCHQVGDEGYDFGPKLTQIGDKLGKDGQYLALMYPNAGVSFGYETHEVKMKDGSKLMGIVASKTETDLMMKFPGGVTQSYKMTQVASIKKLEESMMTAGLHENMKTQELVDLIEYLSSLKK